MDFENLYILVKVFAVYWVQIFEKNTERGTQNDRIVAILSDSGYPVILRDTVRQLKISIDIMKYGFTCKGMKRFGTLNYYVLGKEVEFE